MTPLLKQAAKSLLYRCAPDFADRLHARRADAVIERLRRKTGLADLEDRFLQLHGARVRGGPFAGMEYLAEAKGSVLIPKLLGTYEMELHPWIEQAVQAQPLRILDIGCAEGYYAVGLANRLPSCDVFAFDINPSAQGLCRRLAERNEVQNRVHVAGRCSAADLQRLAGAGTLIICDIEGAEGSFLDPVAIPALRDTTLIVELHDCHVAGVTELVRSRFAVTHQIEEVRPSGREGRWPEVLTGFNEREHAVMLSEHRVSGQSWFCLTPCL